MEEGVALTRAGNLRCAGPLEAFI